MGRMDGTLFFQPAQQIRVFQESEMGCSFKKMGRMDATLFVHPAQLMDCNSKKRDQIDCKFYPAKKDC